MSLPEINLPVFAVDATSSYLLKGWDGPLAPDDRRQRQSKECREPEDCIILPEGWRLEWPAKTVDGAFIPVRTLARTSHRVAA